jgi:hypothetical protein
MFHEFDSMTCRTNVDVFFDVFVHFVAKIFFFQQLERFSCSKWSTYESSWFYFKNSVLKNFKKMYHLIFQRNKSFSIFHLNDESRSTFLRLLFDITSSFLLKSRRFAFSFFLSCFIDVFSTKNRIRCVNESDYCKINNTMQSFKNETLNVAFLLETFFIHLSKQDFRHSRRFWIEAFSRIFRYLETIIWKIFFFKLFFTIATIFLF